ncbi:hypothetical protein FGO68_gene11486 [Halteria grandinella]|uniref:Uncharacterized protein n=1 Tax=Halteria grandinella TaxID=5974 RepID=A0A8J8NIS7_HALGN|nr:hypothetical protein FGO68_gene11486 [Halteria grandinella]
MHFQFELLYAHFIARFCHLSILQLVIHVTPLFFLSASMPYKPLNQSGYFNLILQLPIFSINFHNCD